jgi:hypothetical protein
MTPNIKEIDFVDRQKSLTSTLYFTIVFFVFYYLILIIPKYGISSKIFLIDNIGGSFIVGGSLLAIFLSKKIFRNFILLLPSYGALCTSILFLANIELYQEVDHLWLSAQLIGFVYATFLGTAKSNLVLI